MFVSVGMLSCYAIVVFTMDHNRCNFDLSEYETGRLDLPIYENIRDAPDITKTVELTFIIGLILHVFLFILNVFVDPFVRFNKPDFRSYSQGGGGDFIEQVDPEKEMERIEKLQKQF